MSIVLKEYLDTDGSSPYGDWFDELDARAAARISAAMDRIGRGLFGDVKPVGEGVSERRIDFGPGYRVYFGSETDGRVTNVVILLYGGSKRTQRRDITRAKAYWNDYKSRKRRGEN